MGQPTAAKGYISSPQFSEQPWWAFPLWAVAFRTYVTYYNLSRTHLALDKETPLPQPANRNTTGSIFSVPEVGGLHHSYHRLAA
jgi:hypothetical protein